MECILCGSVYGDYSCNGQSINRTGCCCFCWAAEPEKCEEIAEAWRKAELYDPRIDQEREEEENE